MKNVIDLDKEKGEVLGVNLRLDEELGKVQGQLKEQDKTIRIMDKLLKGERKIKCGHCQSSTKFTGIVYKCTSCDKDTIVGYAEALRNGNGNGKNGNK